MNFGIIGGGGSVVAGGGSIEGRVLRPRIFAGPVLESMKVPWEPGNGGLPLP